MPKIQYWFEFGEVHVFGLLKIRTWVCCLQGEKIT
jgi:hypothetical protein